MKNSLLTSIATLILVGVSCAATNPSLAAKVAVVRSQSIASSMHCTTQAPCTSVRAGIAPGEGSPMPICQPGQNCGDPVMQIAGEGSPMPICQPGQNCGDPVMQIAGEGSPMPICQPGQNCGDPVMQIAGEGSPMPICQPGQNCGDRLLIAGEGSPMPICQPGQNCGDRLTPVLVM
jgi:hypothetical protein